MPKFTFRLQKVLDFRATVEETAKNAYLDARAARLEAEALIAQIENRRSEALQFPVESLDERRSMEQFLLCLEDEVRAQFTVVSVLLGEEEKALAEWHLRKQELEALVKLREKALTEWQAEAGRLEQAELDEWSVTRRRA